ncbi:ABC transporter substrate-binding protein [Thermodesulfovibrio sp. 1176]|uniref:ABC transporter substrate-binding protein n=1 Tax=Thermodesulfovibrio sp. 1176 TaxID=3043424 RepID=UPI002482E86E|nr:ABC transporter substrate-binding protein [Thermodesulfovibrio sp. 1176]MDI1472653.1 ABC transporter substrate-binding protein [Thermodesulfovibrio sp. 1176]
MKKKILYISVGLILVFIILWFTLSQNKQSIKIGLSVTLTGVYPDLGREIRDGALLAVELINEEGEIKEKPLKFIIKDNKYNIEQAKKNYSELVNEGVIAVIGPAASTTAKALLPLINEKKILTIAPTPTSTELAGLDDYMIRLRPTNKDDAEVLAKYVKEKINPKKIVIVYDTLNPIYTIDFAQNFMQNFGKDVKFFLIPFKEGWTDIKELSKKILSYSPDTVLLITEVYNTALIAQNLRILNPDIILLSSPWAKFQRLIDNGGKRIEGLLSIETFDEEYKGELYQKFKKRFIERFGYEPEMGAVVGFESVMIIKQAVESGATREKMKELIIKTGRFQGLQGEIVIDKFGDRVIKPFVVKVEKGKWVRVQE